MRTVTVTLPHSRYDILIEPGLLRHLDTVTKPFLATRSCTIFADDNLPPSYLAAAATSLGRAGANVRTHAFLAGEPNKTLRTAVQLYEVLLDAKQERRSPVFALGGGVTGDLVGFVAATYLRGVPFIQCPTTLLSMVDASVGGKVAVNVPQGKNLIGAFYQPSAVLIDPECLTSLPVREFRCGLAECVKHGLLADATLFDWTEQHTAQLLALDLSTLCELIERNVQIKATIVMEDEKETGIRAWLNLGHTFAHAIEATTGYERFYHGEAVALGLVAATWLSSELGYSDSLLSQRVRDLLGRLGLPTAAELPEAELLQHAMGFDKKVEGGVVRLVLLDGLGRARIERGVDPALVHEAIEQIRK